jgi:hypothetical protein
VLDVSNLALESVGRRVGELEEMNRNSGIARELRSALRKLTPPSSRPEKSAFTSRSPAKSGLDEARTSESGADRSWTAGSGSITR